MKFGLDIAQQQLTWEEIVRRTRFAEDNGYNGVWGFDHFHVFFGDPKGPAYEAYSILAALAAVTSRIRLGILVTGITYRHPAVLASQAVTIDHISHGRLELALGAAWDVEEHEALGIPFPPTGERIQRLGEAIRVMRALMTQDEANFEGTYYRLANATYRPRPVQQPTPPIWVGASGPKMIKLAGELADVWHDGGPVDELIKKSEQLDEAARAAGRDPASIMRASSIGISEPWDEVRERVLGLKEAGFSYVVVGWPGEGWPRVHEFTTDVMPGL
ncbi:MAG TPA: LLM class flavin-dependent oxidoreductase [Chloroflexota bacterium]|nr:LLM class flavin-dependent oxidoreductase [Chloroflexota bacterium]